ncbi:hypothetical protein QBC35DRAFT_238011 [Podospora australis]|uniref:C2H2-type domain-containing protein n=1 Tax=Podospora australis TaxID=1536484 RepID=A0AAN6WSC2_9PEZI|nr:hypothetical protein QBC35DRAFT_238011 [Podospora australis]
MATVVAVVEERSVLAARDSSPLPAGTIAGAVVGSVLGVLFIVLCVFPFAVKARRRWLTRHDEPALAEMGQSPGGPLFTHPDDDSTKKHSNDLHNAASAQGVQPPTTNGSFVLTGHDPSSSPPPPPKTDSDSDHRPQPHQTTIPQGVTGNQGLPSPTSPHSPAFRSDSPAGQAHGEGQAVSSTLAAASPDHSPTDASSPSRHLSKGTIGKDSTRDLSQTKTESFGAPSRQLTGVTFTNIHEEPEALDSQSQRSSTFAESIKRVFKRTSTRRKSTLASLEGARSPSVLTDANDFVPQQVPGGSNDLAHDPNTPGLAWDYYNDPTLTSDLPSEIFNTQGSFSQAGFSQTLYSQPGYSQPYSQPELSQGGFFQADFSQPPYLTTATTATSSGGLTVVPPAHGPTSAPLSPVSPAAQQPSTGLGFVPPMIREGSGTISSNTVTPSNLKFRPQNRIPGPLQRVDSLPPPTIVADIPSPPLQYTAGPSGNPMDFMNPTNSDETAWMITQEILKAESSPSPPSDHFSSPSPPSDNFSSTAASMANFNPGSPPPDNFASVLPQVDENQYLDINKPTLSPEHTQQTPYQSPPYQSPYQSPYQPNLEYQQNFQTTPDIGVQMYQEPIQYDQTNFLATPNYSTPPPSTGPSIQNTPETRLTPFTASPSPPSEIEPSMNAYLQVSPLPSPGQTSPGSTPAPSPGPSPGGLDKVFPCPKCDRVFDQVHKLNHHKRYHERPHVCPHEGCQNKFGTKTHLDRHINDKHCKTRKFYCTQPECPYSRQGGKSFPRKDNWRRHMLNKHHITPTTDPEPEFADDIMSGL